MIIHNTKKIGEGGWWIGEPIDYEVPVPIRFDFEPLRGYQGPPPELVDIGTPIMTARLAAALSAAGVDNVEYFDTILTNTVTGETYDYKTYNIVGLVAATDLGKSDWESYDGTTVGDVSFHSIALDESKCRGALLFRLAESLGTIVIHDKVRESLLAKGIDTLTFVKPEDWMSI